MSKYVNVRANVSLPVINPQCVHIALVQRMLWHIPDRQTLRRNACAMIDTNESKATFVRIIFLYLESAVTTFLAYFISCLYIAGSHQMLRTGTSWHLQLLHFKARLALTFLKCVAIHILLISCLEFFISGRNCGEVFKGVQGVLDCQKTPDLDKSQWTVQTSAWGN